MSMMARPVVIVGAGHAGGTVAALLRQYGHVGSIVLVGEEPVAPYQRPPLSKTWFKQGAGEPPSIALRPEAFYREHGIDLRLGVRASSIDLAKRRVETDAGTFDYDRLILATGAAPRRVTIPGAHGDTLLTLRNVADADRLKSIFHEGTKLAVVGGGYIGLEVAAAARNAGLDVLIVEREARILARTGCAALADFFHDQHVHRGVRFALGQDVASVHLRAGAVHGMTLSRGEEHPVDAVLVGIGATPEVRLAVTAGLACDDGVVVDHRARTSNEHIYAIGDCTRRFLPLYGRSVRLESVPNALEQARHAAADICGTTAPAPEVPWFWSDQYDLKLQIAGLQFDVARSLIRGDPSSGRFAVFHLDSSSRVQCVEAVNAPQELMAGKLLITSRRPVAVAKLADVAVSMKDVAA